VPISIPESLVVALPSILSPSSRTFVELTPRQLAPTVGIAATGFCNPGGILQLFHRQDQQFFHRQDQQIFYRQDQQILQLPTAAVRLLQHIHQPSSTARSHMATSSTSTASRSSSSSARSSSPIQTGWQVSSLTHDFNLVQQNQRPTTSALLLLFARWIRSSTSSTSPLLYVTRI
jgi:hypothetical protein